MATEIAPLIVIVGETASGKTALGIELAQKFNGELICADSWTIRKELNIGTAKPNKTDQQKVQHHLLDIVEPCADFTAAVFKDLAQSTINNIMSKGKLPILVGGAGLYIDGVLFDYGFLDTGDRERRTQFNNLSIHELLTKSQEAGLNTDGIDTRNKRRIIRLLETGGAKPSKKPLRKNTLIVGLQSSSDKFDERVEQRVETMINTGLEQEVKSLADKYGWDCEGLRGIGYIEWREFFEGTQSLEETKKRIVRSTKSLAKRQRTWFRRPVYQESIQWVSNSSEVVDIVTTFLNKNK